MKRHFSSYGPINPETDYYAPRTELLTQVLEQLVGEQPNEGGSYFTVWAPRQRGKSTLLKSALHSLKDDERFYAAKVELQVVGDDFSGTAGHIIDEINAQTGLALPQAKTPAEFEHVFMRQNLDKPLILILDEFDSLKSAVISGMVCVFRDIYIKRMNNSGSINEKRFLLHSVALVGVRSVLGIENEKGSPFNVQRSVPIPNLTKDEVQYMFECYQRESGQKVNQDVIDRLYYETKGQPGLVSFFGELLTEPPPLRYNEHPDQAITMNEWDRVFGLACFALPDNNILNLISKAKQPEYKPTVLELFKTEEKTQFSFDDPIMSFLFMNGVIDYERGEQPGDFYAKFPCPYVQKRLFNRFSRDLNPTIDPILDPFDEMEDVFTEDGLVIPNLLKRYETWLSVHPETFKNAPIRSDGRLFEAVFHFNLFCYLNNLLQNRKIKIWPEFPTGNGKIDILIKDRSERIYGLELKSFRDLYSYRESIPKAADYAKQLGLQEINLAFFIESIGDENRTKLGKRVLDGETGVAVDITFIEHAGNAKK